jgi:hypothetical protein|eukprot:COSAG01_NODE_7013_length_3392_cov_2.581537_4_plen_33_part_00
MLQVNLEKVLIDGHPAIPGQPLVKLESKAFSD